MLTVCYLERRKSYGTTQADEGVDRKQKAFLLVGTCEENQHPEIHGGQGKPIGTAEVLHCSARVRLRKRINTENFFSPRTHTYFLTHH